MAIRPEPPPPPLPAQPPEKPAEETLQEKISEETEKVAENVGITHPSEGKGEGIQKEISGTDIVAKRTLSEEEKIAKAGTLSQKAGTIVHKPPTKPLPAIPQKWLKSVGHEATSAPQPQTKPVATSARQADDFFTEISRLYYETKSVQAKGGKLELEEVRGQQKVAAGERSKGVFKILSLLFHRTGSSSQAREAANERLLRMTTLANSLRQINDPRQVKARTMLKETLMALSSTEWFHGVLHHHPEVSTSLLRAAQAILPPPNAENLKEWVQLTQTLEGSDTSKIKEHIEKYIETIVDKEVSAEAKTLSSKLEQLAEKPDAAQIEAYMKRSTGLATMHGLKETTSPDLKKELFDLVEKSQQLYRNFVIPEAAAKVKALEEKLQKPTEEIANSLDLVETRQQLRDLQSRNLPEPLGTAINKLSADCEEKIHKFTENLLTEFDKAQPKPIKDDEFFQEFSLHLKDLTGPQLDALKETTKGITDIKFRDSTLAAIRHEEQRKALMFAMRPKETEAQLVREGSSSIRQMIQDLVSGSDAKIIGHFGTRTALFATLNELSGEISQSRALAFSTFTQRMIREKEGEDKSPQTTQEAEKILSSLKAIATKLNETAQEPSLGKAILESAQGISEKLNELRAGSATVKGLINKFTDPNQVRAGIEELKQTYQFLTTHDRNAVRNEVMKLPPDSQSKKEALQFMKEQNIRRAIMLSCDTALYTEEMAKEPSDQDKFLLEQQVKNTRLGFSPDTSSPFEVIEALNILIEEALSQHNTSKLQQYKEYLDDWALEHKQLPPAESERIEELINEIELKITYGMG